MNKTAIKNYAVWARVQLIESAKQRAYEYEITENGESNPNLDSVGGRLLSKVEKEQRQQLIAQIRQKGYNQVMEEAAYTWFNRFIALRFMEVNGYLPSKVRMFTDENNAFKPEILKEAMSIELEGLDRSFVLELLDKQDNESLFKYLMIIQCNALSAGLPYMFEKIANWTELLFPANLLRADSVIGRLISDIDVADWNDEVEIIGWFYQYYISEKHAQVVDPLYTRTISKEDIPAATQLFTTDWVVRYILDNSLGRYWIERHPESKLAEKLTYFVRPKDGKIPTVNEAISPEEVKVLDPCVGSGHFLSYAFDILLEIYREYGWSDRDAAKSIIENNLYGLDIDDRAAQLACFAVMMKARKYNRRIISAGTKLHILAMQDSTFMTDELIKYVAGRDASIRNDLNELCIVFNNAKEYGSIINVPQIDYAPLYARIQEIESTPVDNLVDVQYQRSAVEELLPLIQQAEILAWKYDVVATNPPYMNKYSARLKAYIGEHYEDYKGDLFSVFIYRNFGFCKENGYSGFMTPMVWMFIKTYESLRKFVINQKSIATLIQFEYSAYEEATVPICSFVLKNGGETSKGCYFKLSEFRGGMDIQRLKTMEALQQRNCGYYYETDEANFNKIPGSPIAYWAPDSVLFAFVNSPQIGQIAEVKIGMGTGKNDIFVREWWEVQFSKIDFSLTDSAQLEHINGRYVPYNKGGDYRLWYGNQIEVLWFDKSGRTTMASMSGHRENGGFNRYFQKGITWTFISSSNFGVRSIPTGFAFDVAGSTLFTDDRYYEYLLAFLSSSVCNYILKMLNPTMNYQAGNIKSLPVIFNNQELVQKIGTDCVAISQSDWDSFESSWGFQYHPLIVERCEYRDQMELNCNAEARRASVSLISKRFEMWVASCEKRFIQLRANEEELNRIFIDIYGLQGELTPDVADKDVTVRKADLSRDIRSLISYAVGCMMGRYSLDQPGLAFAGGVLDAGKYSSYLPDHDGILPITDDEYFDDDIVGMFVNWVRTVYGEETLEDNLKFIADALGGKGTPREIIRQYFLNDFYADHLKIYQKRPIYWLFSSGKKNGFKCLIYMHRYQPDLLARIRTDYVHEQQERYRTQLTMLQDSLQTAGASERVKLNKQITKIKDQALELQKYEEKIHHLADQMIPIDLDDGVKVNYAKFQDVLEKIK